MILCKRSELQYSHQLFGNIGSNKPFVLLTIFCDRSELDVKEIEIQRKPSEASYFTDD